VTNGLRAMQELAFPDDWVLVHDAARACITPSQVQHLIAELAQHDVGGILAVPVADTLKRAAPDGCIEATVPRDSLWQAQTPQMFRHGLLLRALEAHPDTVTDEAGAIEALGLRPRLVAADAANLKITYPFDLQLAELILGQRKEIR
jgi:2-C-methyl-D-erythritol 4-phosphate cytidylyltransferase